MDLSRENAQAIVTEIGSLLSRHVNLCDDAGTIVASTDPSRVGTWHGGAARIIAEGLPGLVVARDEDYPGARRGLNLPVAVDGQVEGVVGITGEYQEVASYAHVVQKMAEILVRETRERQSRSATDRIHQRFLDQWLLEDAPITSAFVARGLRLGIDVAQPYRVAVVQIAGASDLGHTPESQARIDRVVRVARRHAGQVAGRLVSVLPSRMALLYPAAAMTEADVLAELRILDAAAAAAVGLRLVCGVGEETADARVGFAQADRALRAAVQRGAPVLRFADVTLELVLDDVTQPHRDAFVAWVFRGVRADHLEEAAATLEAYYACDGALRDAAERLYIHKNTLGGRLDKLHACTGLNPRSRVDGVLFHLAVRFLRAGAGSAR